MSIPRIKMHHVISSNIKAAGYNKKHKILRIVFHNDGEYDYHDVEEQDYINIFTSESPGKYLSKHIIPKYKRVKKLK